MRSVLGGPVDHRGSRGVNAEGTAQMVNRIFTASQEGVRFEAELAYDLLGRAK